MQKPREIAFRILLKREHGEDFVENLLDAELSRSNLSPVDRGLCTELAYGIVRRQKTLDWLIGRKTDPTRSPKPELVILLRLGLYQLFWLGRIPDHAAVHETVELGKSLGFRSQAGFLNAILRTYTREKAETGKLLEELESTDLSLGHSHPEWLVERWKRRWGQEKARELLEWNNTPAYSFARVNTLKTDAEKLAKQWEAEGVKFTPKKFDWVEEGLIFQLDAHPPLASLKSFQQGLFYVQDPSTLLAVHELAPKSEETILDLCAAPGGKTTFIAALMQNRGKLVAQDIDPGRLKLVQENVVRLGVTCVHIAVVSSPSPPAKEERRTSFGETPHADPLPTRSSRGEGKDFNPDPALGTRQFDRILIDAPCSNTGVLRRRVDLRWRIRPEEIGRLRKTQLQLLSNAAPRLKPGGVLIYSTCSLESEENAEVVKQFLAEHPQFKLERERELLPFINGVDGAYVTRIKLL